MAAPAIGIRPRWVPLSAGIDWSHPLAAGLSGVVAPSFYAGEIAPNRTSVGARVASQWGQAWDCSGSSTNLTCRPLTMTNGVSFGALAVVNSGGNVHLFTSDGDGGIVGSSTPPSLNKRRWQFRASTTTLTGIVFTAAGTGIATNFNLSSVLSAGVPFAALLTIAPDRTSTLYACTATGLAGTATASASSSGNWVDAVEIDIGRDAAATGSVSAGFLWRRVLPAAQAVAWLADPLAVLRS